MQAPLKKLEAAFGSSIQIRKFGKSDRPIVEVDSKRVVDLCAWIRMEEMFRLDFLEAFTVFEADDRFHFTVFLRSISIGHSLVVRTSLPVTAEAEWVDFPSLTKVWPQAAAYESELGPLFGIRFLGAAAGAVAKDFGKFSGFPLRKAFTWGNEVEP